MHRDFKPDNVLVDGAGVAEPRARVADFGLASIDHSELEVSRSFCKLTRAPASVAGTPAYMAPELLDGSPPDVRSDILAFAVTLYEALHGHHPFAGDNMKERWIEMAAGRVHPNGRRIPAWLDRCVRRGLAADPAERWPDVTSLVAALERRPRRFVAAIAAGAIALTALGALPPSRTRRVRWPMSAMPAPSSPTRPGTRSCASRSSLRSH